MSSKCLFVCPSCHSFYSGAPDGRIRHCSECSSVLDIADSDYDSYAAMSHDQREQFKQDYIRRRFGSAAAAAPVSSSHVPALSPAQSSGWVSLLRGCGYIVILFAVIAGVYLFLTGSFLPGIVSIIAGFVSVSGIMVLCSIHDHVLAIRNHLAARSRRLS